MEKEKLVVQQPFGIGDILFVSPIVRKLDYDIIWPIESHYLWIKDYIKQDNIKFIDVNEYIFTQDYAHLQVADFLNAEPTLKRVGYEFDCMTAKYAYADFALETWKSLYWERNLDKENSLIKYLGIDDGKPYNLINQNFAEPNLGYKIDLNIDNDCRNIYMDYIEGYTLLDWGMAIENSKQFHTVSTSTFYMVEFLNCQNTQLHLYPRYGLDKNLDPIRPIISERWICHE